MEGADMGRGGEKKLKLEIFHLGTPFNKELGEYDPAFVGCNLRLPSGVEYDELIVPHNLVCRYNQVSADVEWTVSTQHVGLGEHEGKTYVLVQYTVSYVRKLKGGGEEKDTISATEGPRDSYYREKNGKTLCTGLMNRGREELAIKGRFSDGLLYFGLKHADVQTPMHDMLMMHDMAP